MTIEFRYFGQTDLVKGHSGIAVVATKIIDHTLYIGFSLCHPKDVYDKELGKQRAIERLQRSPVITTTIENKHKTISKQVVGLLTTPFSDGDWTYYPPSWLKHIF